MKQIFLHNVLKILEYKNCIDDAPVSYTHLDVYKRQTQVCIVFC